MVDIQRGTFLKKIGLCTILLPAGKIREGIVYIAPVFNHNSMTQPASIVDRICFVGVGELGLQTAKPLAKGLYRVPYSPSNNNRCLLVDNSIGILQFISTIRGIDPFVEKRDLVFLIGSITDRDFWIARDLMLGANPKLLINITPSSFETTAIKHILTPRPNESFLFTDKKSFIPHAIHVIQDICSILLLPNLVCIDFLDVCRILTGSFTRAFSIESSMDMSTEKFENLIFINKNYLRQADMLCTIFSYDYRAPSTMEHMCKIGGQIIDHIKQDVDEFLYALNIDQILNTDVRVTLLAAIKRG